LRARGGGESPASAPVNIMTEKSIGLAIPDPFLLRVGEVIE